MLLTQKRLVEDDFRKSLSWLCPRERLSVADRAYFRGLRRREQARSLTLCSFANLSKVDWRNSWTVFS
jgi:hypothetical protein